MGSPNRDLEYERYAKTQIEGVGGERVEFGRLFVPDIASPRISTAELKIPVNPASSGSEAHMLTTGPLVILTFSRLREGVPNITGLIGLRSATLTYGEKDGSPLTVVNARLNYSQGNETWRGEWHDPLKGARSQPIDHFSHFQAEDVTIRGYRGPAQIDESGNITVDEPLLSLALQIRSGMLQRIA